MQEYCLEVTAGKYLFSTLNYSTAIWNICVIINLYLNGFYLRYFISVENLWRKGTCLVSKYL